MNANGTYNGVELGATMGVYNGLNGGAGNGVASNETNSLNIPILDRFPGAAAAYSLRKLRTQYSGPVIRVRRSSDNLETDIGFDSSGNLNTNQLIQFVGANNGFVSIWYSQGVDSNVNFSQTTQGSQPRIVNAGIIDLQNGKPALVFDGTDDFMDVLSSLGSFNYLHNGTDCFMASVQRFGNVSDPNASYALINNNGLSVNSIGYSMFFDDRASIPRNNAVAVFIGPTNVSTNVALNFATPNTQLLITQIIDANNITAANRSILYLNGGSETKNNTIAGAVSLANAPDNMRLGRISNGATFNLLGSVQEIVMWNVDKTSNRNDIEQNINQYYKIY